MQKRTKQTLNHFFLIYTKDSLTVCKNLVESKEKSPVPFNIQWTRVLPVVVPHGEENDIALQCIINLSNGDTLVVERRNLGTVIVTIVG